MEEEVSHKGFKTHKKYLKSSCKCKNVDYGFINLESFFKEVKSFLGPRMDHRIHSILEQFVCNSKSRYSKRFPHVKKFFDFANEWVDSLDIFSKDKDIRKEIIDRTIKNLMKNGFATRFNDRVFSNNCKNNEACDFLISEEATLKSMNVWRFLNEKNYWKCQDFVISAPEIEKFTKRSSNSDLDVEIGSLSKESSTDWYTCRTRLSNQKFVNKIGNKNQNSSKSDVKTFLLRLESPENPNKPAKTTNAMKKSNFQKVETGTNCEKYEKNENTRSWQTQTSQNELKQNRNVQNSSTEIQLDFTIFENPLTKKIVKTKDIATECNLGESKYRKLSKLKLYVHKSTSLDENRLKKVSNLFVPCKTDQLIVGLFEADPSLSDSCLILMRKKFEKDIGNVCSCVNNILDKFERSERKKLCLNCSIRPGRLDFNLGPKVTRSLTSRHFLARIPTCSNVHKRVSWRGYDSKNDFELSQKVSVDFHLFKDTGHDEKLGVKVGEDDEKREVTLVWSRRKEKLVDFEFSLRKFDEAKENSEKITENLIFVQENFGDFKESLNNFKNDDMLNLECFNCEKNVLELSDANFTCSSDSLMQYSLKNHSNEGICNPKQCFCHVFSTENDCDQENVLKRDEKVDVPCKNDKINLENLSEQHISNSDERKLIFVDEKNISDMENKDFIMKSVSENKENIVCSKELKKSDLEIPKKYTVDSNYDNFSENKCSCCGIDIKNKEPITNQNSKASTNENQKTPKNIPSNDSEKCSGNILKTSIQNNHDKSESKLFFTENKSSISEFSFTFSQETNSSASNSFKNEKDTGKTKIPLLQKKFSSKSDRFSKCNCCKNSSTKCSKKGKLEENRFQRKSIIYGNFCGSFPSIDRIKHLIRKKLRKLLLEEKNTEKSISKTFLKNERYLVSISSGKLNNGKIRGESCSKRCPFTAKNHYNNAEDTPETIFSKEIKFQKKKIETIGDCLKESYQKVFENSEIFRKRRMIKYHSKSTDTRDLINEKNEIYWRKKMKLRNEEIINYHKFSKYRDSKKCSRGTILSDNDKNSLKKNQEDELKDFDYDGNVHKKYSDVFNRNIDDRIFEDTYQGDLWNLKKCLMKIDGSSFEDYDFVAFLNDYERKINDLDADFRLKLLQYVALCRSIKNSLIKIRN